MRGVCTPEQLLQFLDRHRTEMPVSKISKETGIGESTLFALLARGEPGGLRMETFIKLVESLGCRVVIAVGVKPNPLVEQALDATKEPA